MAASNLKILRKCMSLGAGTRYLFSKRAWTKSAWPLTKLCFLEWLCMCVHIHLCGFTYVYKYLWISEDNLVCHSSITKHGCFGCVCLCVSSCAHLWMFVYVCVYLYLCLRVFLFWDKVFHWPVTHQVGHAGWQARHRDSSLTICPETKDASCHNQRIQQKFWG